MLRKIYDFKTPNYLISNLFMKIKFHLVVVCILNNIEREFSTFVNYLKNLVVNGNKSSK